MKTPSARKVHVRGNASACSISGNGWHEKDKRKSSWHATSRYVRRYAGSTAPGNSCSFRISTRLLDRFHTPSFVARTSIRCAWNRIPCRRNRSVLMLSWKAEHESSEDGSLASVRTARIALWCVPLLWASYNVVLRQIFDLEDAPTPSVLTLYRSLIASISLVAATAARKSVFSTLDETDTRRLAMASFELGLWNFCGTALQVAGLQWTTATRGGFLLSTCNVLVPMFAAIGGQSVNTTVWFSCLLAALGGTILSLDHAEGQTFAGGMQYLIRGDVAVLSSSVFFALATLRLDKHARENSNFLLVVGKTISMVGFSMMWVLLQDNAWQHPVEAMLAPAVQWNGEPFVWAMVIYSAVGPGGLAAWLQTVGQSRISASQAQTIYAMTPVFSAIMAPLLLSSEAERLGPYGYLGGGILIAAGLLAGLNEPN